MNHLYFGDCLHILESLHHNKGAFIDLIYIDPPFNSKRNYNVLFESIDLKDANAQKQAFADTWSNVSYIDTINELAELDKDLHTFLKTLSEIRISDSAVAYLSTMAIRIYYMHKTLKDTGSFYLHCDSTMSSKLRDICDLIFGEKNFRNEIIWKRTNNPKGSQFKDRKYGVYTDTILFYTKSDEYLFELDRIRTPLTKDELLIKYNKQDEKGRYLEYPILRSASKGERPNLVYEYKGYTPNKWGWVVKKEKLMEIDKRGDLAWRKNGSPYRKYREEEDRGKPLGNLWDDILRIQSQSEEDLEYPTQKPQALLERIISASSNEGDLVADFFCGCGTTIAAAQALKRNWLGVDISHLAIRLISKRLVDTYGLGVKHNFTITGFPEDIGSAKELAQSTDKGRFNFQEWVIEVLLNGVVNPKKVADGGYDGYLTFNITEKQKEFVLIEVKSGNVNVKNIREFIQVVEKQKAAIGIFVCFEEQVTQPMLKEAKLAGNYHYTGTGYQSDFQKIQISTIEELMKNQFPKIPESTKTTFKRAQKTKDESAKSFGLFD